MAQITLNQSVFLALELRSKLLGNVEAEKRQTGMGQRYAAYLLDQIISRPEKSQDFDQVQRDLGYAMAMIVVHRTATKDEVDRFVAEAKAFDMKVSGSILHKADLPEQAAAQKPSLD